jgi:hypothetical protein
MTENKPDGSSSDVGIACSGIACDLTALNAVERERRRLLAAKIHKAVAGRRELADGYALRIARDKVSADELEDWIGLERRCCPFLRFAPAQEGDDFWLHLTGGPGVKEFLKSEMGA